MGLKEDVRIRGRLKLTFRDAATGEIRRISEYQNAVTSVALNMICKRLSGDGNSCNITWGAVGTGTFPGTPASSIKLVTELSRSPVTAISDAGAVVTVISFFGASVANGTLTEFGLFGEAASVTPDSGTMFNHAAITETKTTSETLTVESTITLS